MLEVQLTPFADELKDKLGRFEVWKQKLVTDKTLLGGEPAFPNSRLAVRHVGGMLLRGASVAELRRTTLT